MNNHFILFLIVGIFALVVIWRVFDFVVSKNTSYSSESLLGKIVRRVDCLCFGGEILSGFEFRENG